jgi:transposase-like protein
MSKKRTKYTSAFKTKLVLELLQNKSTLVQVASKHNILPQNLQNWKKTFLNCCLNLLGFYKFKLLFEIVGVL